jgi:large subunit ribosomal protein L6
MRSTGVLCSYVGKRPLRYSTDVSITTAPYTPTIQFPRASNEIIVKGPLGQLSFPIDSFISLSFPEAPPNFPKQIAALSVTNPADKKQKTMWGTVNSLVANMIEGVSEGMTTWNMLIIAGFTVPLRLNGVGYRAQLEGGKLCLKLGFSHPVNLDVPSGVEVSIPSPQRIILRGIDLQRVTQFAANIRKWRYVNDAPYG